MSAVTKVGLILFFFIKSMATILVLSTLLSFFILSFINFKKLLLQYCLNKMDIGKKKSELYN